MMKNGLDVFDFKEEDELPEKLDGQILEKFKYPKNNNPDDHLLKYKFLECVAQESYVRKEVGNVPCVDVDAIDCDQSFEDAHTSKQDDAFTEITQGMVEEDFASKEESIGLDVSTQWNSMAAEETPTVNEDNEKFENCHLESGNSCLQNGLIDITSGADECANESLPSSPTSETAEDEIFLDGDSSHHCSNDFEMDDVVVLHPDYVEYLDSHYLAPIISFSCTGIIITDSTGDTPFSFQTGIDDILDIRCNYFEKMGLVNVKLHVFSRDTVQVDNAHGASGVQEIRFTVVEPFWPGKLEEITSLSVKYSSLWHVVFDEDTELEKGRSRKRKCYLPKFDKPFEDVIYPKGDVDAVSISKRDVDLLQPETFINDTIIDFYIKYLKNQIPPANKHKYHFFNSFFFRKLADLDKDPSSISDGRAAFLRVHKWTRKVDIFGKDYVFIPVNFNLHWSLIVICHPGEVATFKNESLEKSAKVPCILHMDSIKGSHAGLKNLVQRYLCEEWKVRHNETSEDVSSKKLNLRFIPLELPQQENSYDCGLFLLHYLECFLAEAPENFNPFKIPKSSNFLNVNWFPTPEVCLKRALIQRLIFEVIENQLWETTPAVCDDPQSSKFPVADKNGKCVEFVSEKCGPTVTCHGNLSTSEADQGIAVTLLVASTSLKNEPGLVLRDLFEAGTSAAPTLGRFQSFAQPSSYYQPNSPTTPKVEHVDAGGKYDVYMPSVESDFPQIIESTGHAEHESMAYTSEDFETPWNPKISMQMDHTIDTLPDTSSCSSDDLEDLGIIENIPAVKDFGQNLEQASVEKLECLKEIPDYTSCEPSMTLTAEDLRSPNELQDGNGTSELSDVGNFLENSLGQDLAKMKNEDIPCDDSAKMENEDVPWDDSAKMENEDVPFDDDSAKMENEEVPCDDSPKMENEEAPFDDSAKMENNDITAKIENKDVPCDDDESAKVESKDIPCDDSSTKMENEDVPYDEIDMEMIGNDCLADLEGGQRATKRLRVTGPSEITASEDLHL